MPCVDVGNTLLWRTVNKSLVIITAQTTGLFADILLSLNNKITRSSSIFRNRNKMLASAFLPRSCLFTPPSALIIWRPGRCITAHLYWAILGVSGSSLHSLLRACANQSGTISFPQRLIYDLLYCIVTLFHIKSDSERKRCLGYRSSVYSQEKWDDARWIRVVNMCTNR